MLALLLVSLSLGQECAAAEACPERVAAIYSDGMAALPKAYAEGGSAESLTPIRAAATALERLSQGIPGPAEIARLVLMAAAAAAQQERPEMGAYLAQATDMEVLQLEAGQPGAPGISALEAAGDLWLLVYRYDDARAAYERAARYLGMTPRIQAGFARLPR